MHKRLHHAILPTLLGVAAMLAGPHAALAASKTPELIPAEVTFTLRMTRTGKAEEGNDPVVTTIDYALSMPAQFEFSLDGNADVTKTLINNTKPHGSVFNVTMPMELISRQGHPDVPAAFLYEAEHRDGTYSGLRLQGFSYTAFAKTIGIRHHRPTTERLANGEGEETDESKEGGVTDCAMRYLNARESQTVAVLKVPQTRYCTGNDTIAGPDGADTGTDDCFDQIDVKSDP